MEIWSSTMDSSRVRVRQTNITQERLYSTMQATWSNVVLNILETFPNFRFIIKLFVGLGVHNGRIHGISL